VGCETPSLLDSSDEYGAPTPLDRDLPGKEWICSDSEKHGHDVDAAD